MGESSEFNNFANLITKNLEEFYRKTEREFEETLVQEDLRSDKLAILDSISTISLPDQTAATKEAIVREVSDGQDVRAIALLTRYLKENIGDAKAWKALGLMLADCCQDGEDHYIRALKVSYSLDKSQTDLLLHLAKAYANEYGPAMKVYCLRFWLALQSKYASMASSLESKDSCISDSLSQIQEITIEDFSRAFHQKGGNSDPKFCEAYFLLTIGTSHKEKCFEAISKSLELDRNNFRLWNMCHTLCTSFLGKSVTAQLYLQKAFNIKPNYLRYFENRAILETCASEVFSNH